VVQAGLADRAVPLAELGPEVVRRVGRPLVPAPLAPGSSGRGG
jgi:hypothetical protein